jgi:hypothetical protein
MSVEVEENSNDGMKIQKKNKNKIYKLNIRKVKKIIYTQNADLV